MRLVSQQEEQFLFLQQEAKQLDNIKAPRRLRHQNQFQDGNAIGQEKMNNPSKSSKTFKYYHFNEV